MKKVIFVMLLFICSKFYSQTGHVYTYEPGYYDRAKMAILAAKMDEDRAKEARINCDQSASDHSETLNEIKSKINPVIQKDLANKEKYVKELNEIKKANDKSFSKCSSPRYTKLRENVDTKLNELYAEITRKY